MEGCGASGQGNARSAEHAAGAGPTDPRDVPIAYHYQLRELLRAAIVRGDYVTETRFPSEHELCRTYQVSRTTVRQALQAPVREGLLYPVCGRGTFVTHAKILEGLATLPT
jgi:GntR family transcriptional regulator